MTASALRIGAASVFALCLAVYGATLYPTVPGGDAGELVVVAANGAVAHPPGYPLWTMLAWLFTWLPAGSIAWRVAWLSAVCSAAAATAIFWCVASHLSNDDENSNALAAGALAAGLFAWSPTVWLYAVGAEVFPLHCFFVALLFALALLWERDRSLRLALAIAFTCALGLTNHLTLVFYVVPIAAWVMWTGRRELWNGATLGRLAIAAFAGFTPYAYLWIAGHAENPYSWGDSATASGLVDHLLRRDYGTFQLLPDGHAQSSSWAAKLLAYGIHFSTATLGAGLLFAGAAVVLARDRAYVRLLAGCAAFYLGAFSALANVAVSDPFLRGVLARFWMQGDVPLAILAGIGFGIVSARLTAGSRAMVWSAAAVLLVARLGTSGAERAGRGEGVVEDYGRAILEPLPPNTLLLTQGDLITNVVRYLQTAEHVREDVVVLDQELLTKPWYVRRVSALHPDVHFPGEVYHPGVEGGFSMRAFLDANRGIEHIALYPDWKDGDASIDGQWRAWPDGLASRVLPASAGVDPSRWALESGKALAVLEARGWPSMDRYERGAWERVALDDVWQARHRRAVVLLTEAIARRNDMGLLAVARGELEAAARTNPDPPRELFRNLGIVYSRLAPSQPYLQAEEAKAWKRYLALADGDDPDRAAIEARLKELEKK